MEERKYDSTYSEDRPYMVMNGPENGGILFLRNFGKKPTLKVKNPQNRIGVIIEFTISNFGGQKF
jgi:hypothetical protein